MDKVKIVKQFNEQHPLLGHAFYRFYREQAATNFLVRNRLIGEITEEELLGE